MCTIVKINPTSFNTLNVLLSKRSLPVKTVARVFNKDPQAKLVAMQNNFAHCIESWLAISVLNLSRPDSPSFWSGLAADLSGSGCFLPNRSEDLIGRFRALLAVPHGGEMKTKIMRPASAEIICNKG